jgi:hypothetical protein
VLSFTYQLSNLNPGQVSLEILHNEIQGPDVPNETVTFTVGKWSDANIATLEEAAATIRKTLDVPGGGVSDEVCYLQLGE